MKDGSLAKFVLSLVMCRVVDALLNTEEVLQERRLWFGCCQEFITR